MGAMGQSAIVDEWRSLSAAHATTSAALERALRKRHGLTLSEFEVLQVLGGQEHGKCLMKELVDGTHVTQSSLSRLVGRMEAAGLVDRTICEHDRRGIYARLTPEGERRYREAQPTQVEVLEATLGVAT
jgi:DNA-binding MarR family transcriptional regulator